MERDLSSISIFDLRRRIQSFQGLNLENSSIEVIDQRLRRIMNQYHVKPNTLYLNGLFRARKNRHEDFGHVSDLWYPPKEKIKNFGRFNEIGQSLFYASNRLHTAISELRHKVGDRITILVVRPKEEAAYFRNIIFIGLGRSTSPDISIIKKSETLQNSEKFKKSIGIKNHKKFVLIDKFLEDLLTLRVEEGQEFQYKPTVALGRILFSIPNIDALNYPSVATNFNGINFCTIPEKADEHFFGEEAWVVDIVRVGKLPKTGEVLYETKFVKRSEKIGADGKIKWLKEGERIDYQSISKLAGGVTPLDEEPRPFFS